MQWWYGHNAVAFFLTTPFLGLMYYFMPKAAERPVYSYRLSILHFWSLVFIYIWAGPHHLHYTALPEWASTLGMVVLAHALDAELGRHDQRPAHAARGVGQGGRRSRCSSSSSSRVTFYGMATFEGPMLSIKCVNALAHYTDWIIAHVHAGTLGLERLHDVRHDLLAAAAAVPDQALQQEARGVALLDRQRSASCSTSSRSTAPASPRA